MELIYNIKIINNTQAIIRMNYKKQIKNIIKTTISINIDLRKMMI